MLLQLQYLLTLDNLFTVIPDGNHRINAKSWLKNKKSISNLHYLHGRRQLEAEGIVSLPGFSNVVQM